MKKFVCQRKTVLQSANYTEADDQIKETSLIRLCNLLSL